MGRETTTLCDQCGEDITTTGNCEDYCIGLFNRPIPSRGGAVTAVAAHPHLERDYYFCDWRCLEKWFLGKVARK